ncbi:MAG TPA: alpha/beta hydrolase-fold protein, partial [Myxococcota bacterium]|nr:alpha/beta hydrolase-fold protein [Myxococcota bacterium]
MAKRGGKLVIETFASRALRGNPLRDPHLRRVPVWLPPSYPDGGPYPVLYLLVGFTGTGMMHLDRAPWVEPIDERLNRLAAAGKLRDAIVVMPDCWTRYGGSQYLDSSATGRYETHVVKELVPWIDGRYRTRR